MTAFRIKIIARTNEILVNSGVLTTHGTHKQTLDKNTYQYHWLTHTKELLYV
jgi:hypothetical protein